jgi:hypothetical protein
VPNRREPNRGTLRAIHKQALRHIPAEELATHFFSD